MDFWSWITADWKWMPIAIAAIAMVAGVARLAIAVANTIKERRQEKHPVPQIQEGKPNYRALILAAGASMRWQASIIPFEDHYYSTLYWKKVNENLNSKGLPSLREPPSNVGLHKACALLNDNPIIQYAFLSYLKARIKDISVVASTASPAQNQIVDYVRFWNSRATLKVDPRLISGKSEITTSVFEGMKNLPNRRDIIISYSDIVWKQELLEKLLEQKDGDIVILVDTAWRNNYPPTKRRIWHDELYAELVFGQKGKIERIGEVINRFEDIPRWSVNDNRVEKFDPIFQHNCIGEIVGLFKFSPKARRVFCEKYSTIVNSEKPNIHVVEWKPPLVPEIQFRPKTGLLPIKQALLGCFFEYLSRQEPDLYITVLEVEGGWAEIDHWGDVCLTEERISHGEQLLD